MINNHDQSSDFAAEASATDVLSDMPLGAADRLDAVLVDASRPWFSWAPQTESFRGLVLPAAQHLISFHIVTRGGCWAGLAGETPERLEAGTTCGRRAWGLYYLADPPTAEPSYGFEQALSFFSNMAAGRMPSTVVEVAADPRRRNFCGFLGCDLQPFNPVLRHCRLLRIRSATGVAGSSGRLRDAGVARNPYGERRREIADGGVVVRRCHSPLPRDTGRRTGRLAGRLAKSSGLANFGIAARRSNAELDPGGACSAGRIIAFGNCRALHAFHRATTDAISAASSCNWQSRALAERGGKIASVAAAVGQIGLPSVELPEVRRRLARSMATPFVTSIGFGEVNQAAAVRFPAPPNPRVL